MTRSDSHEQVLALASSALLLAAVLWPVRQNWSSRRRDDFPLSYYPMFSARRRAHGSVIHPVGVTRDGARLNLPYQLCGTGGFNQVRRQVARHVADGRAQALADWLAERVARSTDPALAQVDQVDVVTGRFRYDAYFRGDRLPVGETVHATAPVSRRPR